VSRDGGGPGASAAAVGPVRLLPDLNVIKVGATSIIESGREAVMSVVSELAAAAKAHQILITTGGGERHRHVYTVGSDLGMPAGVLAVLGGSGPMQNALILQALLASHGGTRIPPDHFDEIPVYLAAGAIPITSGMPTYDYWEHPPREGELPTHDTDVGAYLMAETFGARTVIYVKDVDGVYTSDPKLDPDARHLPDVTVKELRGLNPPSLPIEEPVLQMMENGRTVRAVRIVNGHVPGQLTKALRGEAVGTVLRAA
jgi:molybdenum storage protein